MIHIILVEADLSSAQDIQKSDCLKTSRKAAKAALNWNDKVLTKEVEC